MSDPAMRYPVTDSEFEDINFTQSDYDKSQDSSNRRSNQRVVAVVQPQPRRSAPQPQALREHLRDVFNLRGTHEAVTPEPIVGTDQPPEQAAEAVQRSIQRGRRTRLARDRKRRIALVECLLTNFEAILEICKNL